MLQPSKAKSGKCGGCKTSVKKGSCVMDCRDCNWHLCQDCHPQESQDSEEDWFWGGLSYIVSEAQREITEITEEISGMSGDFETFVSDVFVQGGCTVIDGKQLQKDEISFGDTTVAPTNADRSIQPGKKVKGKKNSKLPTEKLPTKEASDADDIAKAVPTPAVAPLSATSACGSAENAAEQAALPRPRPLPRLSKQKADPPRPQQAKQPQADLLDLGQSDLLDMELEPQRQVPMRAASLPVPLTPQQPAMPAEAAKGFAAAAAGDDLLDLDFGAPAAASAGNAGPVTDAMSDLEFGDFTAAAPAASPLAAPTGQVWQVHPPLSSKAAQMPDLLDLC